MVTLRDTTRHATIDIAVAINITAMEPRAGCRMNRLTIRHLIVITPPLFNIGAIGRATAKNRHWRRFGCQYAVYRSRHRHATFCRRHAAHRVSRVIRLPVGIAGIVPTAGTALYQGC